MSLERMHKILEELPGYVTLDELKFQGLPEEKISSLFQKYQPIFVHEGTPVYSKNIVLDYFSKEFKISTRKGRGFTLILDKDFITFFDLSLSHISKDFIVDIFHKCQNSSFSPETRVVSPGEVPSSFSEYADSFHHANRGSLLTSMLCFWKRQYEK